MMPRVRATAMPRLRPTRRRVGTAPAASVATPPALVVRRAEEVLRHPARVLTDDERTQYLEHGYVALPSHISHELVGKINSLNEQHIESSRSLPPEHEAGFPVAESPLSEHYILAPGHTADAPRLTRLSSPPA